VGLVNNLVGEVIEIPEFGPAYRAGIRKGDIIVSDANILRGTPGEEVSITIERSSQLITFKIIRERICYETI